MSLPIDRLRLYSKSTWDFMKDCVFTMDQADKQEPIKKYPDKPYLKYVTETIADETLCAIVKHRRMIITWTLCGVFTHDAMFNEGRFNALMSKKEEDSDELVRRCKFIHESIPEKILPVKPRGVYKYTQYSFPEIDSAIKGVAQGKDQLRQYTCSRIGADEIAFWPSALESFVAMKPTIEGGGKVCLVSTRFPGFFKELIEDTLDVA